MSTLIFAHHIDGKFPKGVLEACTYGKHLGADVVAVTYGAPAQDQIDMLGAHGATKVMKAGALTDPDDGQMTKLVAAAAEAAGATNVICCMDLVGKAVAPRLSARMKAGLVSGANALPEGDTIQKPVFSGKAFAKEKVITSKRVISLIPNSIPAEAGGAAAAVEDFSGDFGTSKVSVKETKKRSGSIALPEAELVVSAGRGLKGPENWGMVEEMAELLGAATACSRPVADIGWRPHHEHVGQTGVAIRPNLYIAIGISGAIQHLAGVNQSKVMVVVNTDPEAPFFKAADYGVVGDAFEVIPKLNEAIKAFKG